MKQRPPKRMKPNVFYVKLTFDEAMKYFQWKVSQEMNKAVDSALFNGFNHKTYSKGIRIK